MTTLLIVICAILIAFFGTVGVVVFFKMLDAINLATERSRVTSERCISELQTSHQNHTHKMEEWHQRDIKEVHDHVERLVTLNMVDPDKRAMLANTHAEERSKADELAKQHGHNSRIADMHENIAREENKVPVEQPRNERTKIETSDALKARKAIGEDKIPLRHGR